MSTYKTPGVYVEETPNLPPSVVEVASAVPAFVGYTVKAVSAAPEDLRFKPTLVRSMLDFEEFFGDAGAEGAVVHLTDAAGLVTVVGIDDPPVYHPLYFAMRMFFENGGRRCYVVSVGARTAGSASTLELADLTKGVETLALEDEVTLLVVPEARSLPATDYKTLATIMLAQCAQLRDRFAIFDLPVIPSEPQADSAIAARACFPDDAALMYGAAYYPDLRTTLAFPYVETKAADGGGVTSNVLVQVNDGPALDLASLAGDRQARYDAATSALGTHHVTVSPSGAMAGVYAANDAARGVWKAPANVALQSVAAPVVSLTERDSERLNVDAAGGKSINTIRAFPGRGTRVWGARTLAGNDNEWRYVPIRRFLSVVEESIAKSTSWAVFEPNDAKTWVKVRAMIENYLVRKWRDGALMGTTTDEAFFVRCGLGSTMTGQDIADGRLIVELGVAPIRPAEFVIVRISHRMQA